MLLLFVLVVRPWIVDLDEDGADDDVQGIDNGVRVARV
jgi:hypothetical protein